MKKFRANKKASQYKSLDSYLEAVWRKHGEEISNIMVDYDDFEYGGKVISFQKSKKTRWKNAVKEIYKEKEYDRTLDRNIRNIDEAIDKASRSTLTSYDFRMHQLIADVFKKESKKGGKVYAVYQEIKERIGKTNKFIPENLVFEGYGDAGSIWYSYEFERAERIEKIAKSGRKYYKYTGNRIKNKFYLVYYLSPDNESYGSYEVVDQIGRNLRK